MDQIDINLFQAWNRISADVRADRVEALRRAERQFGRTIRRPMRVWSLCLRASDTRLSPGNCAVGPMEGEPLGPDDSSDVLIDKHRPHELTIPGTTIRELTRPVQINWPGEDWTVVAAKCGVRKQLIRKWMENGTVRVFEHRPAWSMGKRGQAVPIVYTPSPIDPNGFNASGPDRMWGSLWQHMWEKLPEEFVQTAGRVPMYQTRGGRRVFKRWKWVCPGRIGPNGEYIGCGRTCYRLYGPLPPWTVPEALDDRLEIEMPGDSGLAGAWSPGFTDWSRGQRSFACSECWGLRNFSLLGPEGWNLFVTHLTGGLLYGHEVERPMDEAPEVRKVPYLKRKKRPAPQRERVKELLLAGCSYKQIAERMGFALATAYSTARRVYLEHDVKDREQLQARCRDEGESADAGFVHPAVARPL